MSEKLGQLLLKGWTMLSDSCPLGCAVPLMENRREQPPKSVCVQCNKQFTRRVTADGEVEYLVHLSEEERKKKEEEERKEAEAKRDRELLAQKQERLRQEEEKERQLKLEQQQRQLELFQTQMIDEAVKFIEEPSSHSSRHHPTVSSSSTSHHSQQKDPETTSTPTTSQSRSNHQPHQPRKRAAQLKEDHNNEEDEELEHLLRLRNRALRVSQTALYHKLEEIGERLKTTPVDTVERLEWVKNLTGSMTTLSDSILALDRLRTTI